MTSALKQPQMSKSQEGRSRSLWSSLFDSSDPLEKQYQRYRALGKEQMLTIFLVAMSVITVAKAPFFELEDPVQVVRMGSFMLIYVYTWLLRILFHFYPDLTRHWDYFVFVGALHMIVSYSFSHDRIENLMGEHRSAAICGHETDSQASIASVLLGAGLLIKMRWQFFAALVAMAPICYFCVGSTFGCLGCESGYRDLEMGALNLTGLGALVLIGAVLNERDRRLLWDSCRDTALVMSKLKVAQSLRDRLLRAVFDVSFAVKKTPSGDLQVLGEWPAFDNFIGKPTADSNVSSYMPQCDRQRFLDYVRMALAQTDEAIPASLLSVDFEPEPGCKRAANMYIVSAPDESVLTVCLSTKGGEGDEFKGCAIDVASVDISSMVAAGEGAAKTGAAEAASAMAAKCKKAPTIPRMRPAAPPSLHSAPTICAKQRPETMRLLSACEDDCLRPDSVAWVEGQPLPQPLSAVRAGQRVLCHDSVSKGLRYTEVLDAKTEKGFAKWVSVKLEDGTSLQMTSNHPVLPLTDREDAQDRAVRASDLCPGSDFLMVLKSMPVCVEDIVSDESEACEDRVFLTLHQPQRHSLFVASPPGDGVSAPVVQTMAVGSADVRPSLPHTTDELTVKNTFIDLPQDAVPVLKRSNSAPPEMFEASREQMVEADFDFEEPLSPVPIKDTWGFEAKGEPTFYFNPTPSVSNGSYMSSLSDSISIAVSSQDGENEVVLAPPMQPVWRGGLGGPASSLQLEPRQHCGVSLSEVLSIHNVKLKSLGSIEHSQGNCKTCLFANRADHAGGMPCKKGVLCERCHEDHDVMTRRKPKTGRQRERSKRGW